MKKRLGLIGYPLDHSFSPDYFREKFVREGIMGVRYDAYPLEAVTDLPDLLSAYPNLVGLNVTIPYKQTVIPLLDHLTSDAREIGAVNCIAITPKGLIGTNTDWVGFEQSLTHWLQNEKRPMPRRAFILGTGGAAAAVRYALYKMHLPWVEVSRTPKHGQWGYAQLQTHLCSDVPVLIVHTTPLGTWPHINQMPPMDVSEMSSVHFVYDLVYNPAESLLLQMCSAKGAATKNGLEMLHIQAEKAWEFWNRSLTNETTD